MANIRKAMRKDIEAMTNSSQDKTPRHIKYEGKVYEVCGGALSVSGPLHDVDALLAAERQKGADEFTKFHHNPIVNQKNKEIAALERELAKWKCSCGHSAEDHDEKIKGPYRERIDELTAENERLRAVRSLPKG